MNGGIIGNKELCDAMDMKYDEDKKKFYIIVDDFSKILHSVEYKYEINILNQQHDCNGAYDNDYIDISDYWDMVSGDSLEYIIDFIVDEELYIDDVDGEELLLTKEHMKIKDNKIYIGDIILDDSLIKDEDVLKKLLEKLKWSMANAENYSICDKIEIKIIKEFEKQIGEYERMYVKNYKGIEEEKIKLYLDKMNLTEIKDMLIDYTIKNDIIDGDSECYLGENVRDLCRELELFDFDTPDYDNVFKHINGNIFIYY